MSFSSMESLNPHDRDPEDDVPDDRKVNKRTNSKGSKIEPGPGLAAEEGGGLRMFSMEMCRGTNNPLTVAASRC